MLKAEPSWNVSAYETPGCRSLTVFIVFSRLMTPADGAGIIQYNIAKQRFRAMPTNLRWQHDLIQT